MLRERALANASGSGRRNCIREPYAQSIFFAMACRHTSSMSGACVSIFDNLATHTQGACSLAVVVTISIARMHSVRQLSRISAFPTTNMVGLNARKNYDNHKVQPPPFTSTGQRCAYPADHSKNRKNQCWGFSLTRFQLLENTKHGRGSEYHAYVAVLDIINIPTHSTDTKQEYFIT
jgi:hypothetical protein